MLTKLIYKIDKFIMEPKYFFLWLGLFFLTAMIFFFLMGVSIAVDAELFKHIKKEYIIIFW